jgi:hypothetical protein
VYRVAICCWPMPMSHTVYVVACAYCSWRQNDQRLLVCSTPQGNYHSMHCEYQIRQCRQTNRGRSPFLRSGLTNIGSDSTVANDTLLLGVISRRQMPRKPELAVDSAASGVAARLGVPGPPGKMRERERTSVPVGSPLSPQSRSFRSLLACTAGTVRVEGGWWVGNVTWSSGGWMIGGECKEG